MKFVAFWEQSLQDLRYALRMMAGQPLFTAMAALSLALGIGANTAIYSFMDAILLRALPVANPESLVVLNWHSKDHPPVAHSLNGSTFKDPKGGLTSGNFPYSAYELLHANSPVFSSLFAFFGAGAPVRSICRVADRPMSPMASTYRASISAVSASLPPPGG